MLKIENDDFKYTYDDSEYVLKDFARYLVVQGKTERDAQQIRNRVQYVWGCVDQNLSVIYNKLKYKTDIEDLYFLKLFKAVYNNESNTSYEKKRKHNQASTIGSRLLALEAFFNFLEVRDIFIDITLQQMVKVTRKLKELSKRLHKYITIRQEVVYKWKKENLLTMADFIAIGSTPYVVKLGKILEDPLSSKLTTNLVSECRNLLIFIICQGNAARSSNIQEITLEHIDNAKSSKE
ncbi:uncharacterized protein [Clytia hemisphaerica]|uniref:uncharacterized protein n=1 Tax=Clytia hemisphaerica TaxID=252671 RepID=UPI0034D5B479